MASSHAVPEVERRRRIRLALNLRNLEIRKMRKAGLKPEWSWSLAGIARAAGVHKSTVTRWQRKPWFPNRAVNGAYDVRQVIEAARNAGKLKGSVFAAPWPELSAPTPSPARMLPGALLTPAPEVVVPEVSYIQAIPARVGEIPAAPCRGSGLPAS